MAAEEEEMVVVAEEAVEVVAVVAEELVVVEEVALVLVRVEKEVAVAVAVEEGAEEAAEEVVAEVEHNNNDKAQIDGRGNKWLIVEGLRIILEVSFLSYNNLDLYIKILPLREMIIVASLQEFYSLLQR